MKIKCAVCNELLDFHSKEVLDGEQLKTKKLYYGENPFKEGDFTVCGSCGAVNIATREGLLEASASDILMLPIPQLTTLYLAHAAVRAHLEHKGTKV